MTKKIAALALSAASLSGIGMAATASASMPTNYVHYSANYSSMAECNYYFSGVMAQIQRGGGKNIGHGVCGPINVKQYGYHKINYLSPSGKALVSGDKAGY